MAALSRPIDTSNIDTSSDYPMIEEGWHSALISTSDEEENKKGTGRNIILEFTIGQGKWSGKTIRTWLCYQHSTAKTQEIALKLLTKIMNAVGVPSPLKDTAQLHNKPLRIKVGIDGTYNTIEDVEPYTAQAKDLYAPAEKKEEQQDAFADLEEPDWKK